MITINTVLIGLLPTVLVARRSQCTNTFEQPGIAMHNDHFSGSISLRDGSISPPNSIGQQGGAWVQGDFHPAPSTHDDPSNARNYDRPSGTNSGGKTARNCHPGGIDAPLCEGIVKVVGDTINKANWHAPGMRSGGEIVLADAC